MAHMDPIELFRYASKLFDCHLLSTLTRGRKCDNGRGTAKFRRCRSTIARTPERIRRENRQTTQHVTAQFDKDAVTTEEARKLVEERMVGFRVPEGYSWDFGQWGHDRDEALGTMSDALQQPVLHAGDIAAWLLAATECASAVQAAMQALAEAKPEASLSELQYWVDATAQSVASTRRRLWSSYLP